MRRFHQSTVLSRDINLLNSMGRNVISDEYFNTVPGATVTFHCPNYDAATPRIYAVDEAVITPELTDHDMISDTGFIVLANVNENDSKMYVCAVPGVKDYAQVRIHVKVKDKSLQSSQELIDIPSFRRFPMVGAAAKAKRRQQKKKRRKKYLTEDETTTALPSTTTTKPPTTTDLAENPDNPPGAKPDELEEYKNRTELRKTLYPPSKPTVMKVSDTEVQVKWSINIMKDHPVKYFMIQYVEKNRLDMVLGGGNECHDVENVLTSLYWHNFDRLMPGHSYQFQVAAVYDGKKFLFKTSEWSDWFLL
ncbi:uncharacterized protein [Bemisia tabaci]|uniref:uncharacterized protein isoform X2 n=1 Tax=Bemisia tabaci TaxID=7038 RepID=UPI003B27F402